jgi:insulysin
MNIIKSDLDNRKYKYITLKNKLKVIIISDLDAEMSAACMRINSGFRDDSVSGLAHFLEHMLFMGTVEYPKENHYFEFINKNGGMSNAGTGFDMTQYYFNILPNNFFEGLKIFSTFFTNPLLKNNSIQKEINAVNSEHNKNINNDGRRLYRLFGEIINTDHPLKKFGTGNTETLNIKNIREKLINFYNCFYKPNNMSLVVLSNHSIEEIEEQILLNYSNVGKSLNSSENKCVEEKKKSFNQPFNFQNDDILVKINPIMDNDTVMLIYQLDNKKEYYNFKPYEYLFYFFNNESKGSLYYYLKDKNLLNNIHCEVLHYNKSIFLFCINLDLTEKGYNNKFDIINIVENYFHEYVLKNFQSFIYNDLKKINELNFKFKKKEYPIDYVQEISDNLEEFDIKDLLFGHYKMIDLNNNVITNIKKIFSRINKNKIILLSSKKNKLKNYKTEKFYNINYEINYKYNSGKKNNFDNIKNIFFNKKNIYIPKNVELLKNIDTTKNPILISKHKLWYKFDIKFKKPTVYLLYIIHSKNIYDNINNYVRINLFLNIITHILNKDLYDASRINYNYSFSLSKDDLIINIEGFSENINSYVLNIFNTLFNQQLYDFESIFNLQKNNFIKNLKNYKYNEPYKHITNFMKNNIYKKHYTKKQCLDELKKINFNSFTENIFGTIIKDISIKTFIQGNFSKDNSIKLFNNIKDILTNTKIKIITIDESSLKIFKNYVLLDNIYKKKFSIVYNNLDESNINSAIKVFFCIGYIKKNNSLTPKWAKLLALIFLTHKIINEPFFNSLRTEQQLGYIVKSFIDKIGSSRYPYYGYSFLIQSDKKKTIYMNKRIEEFLKKIKKNLIEKLSESHLNKYKNTIILELNQKDKSLLENFNHNSSQIINSDYSFNYREIISSKVKKVKRNDLINFFNNIFINKYSKVVIIGSEKK